MPAEPDDNQDDGRAPWGERIYVHQLHQKVDFLRGCKQVTKSVMYRDAGIPANALSTSRTHDSRLSLEHQRRLGNYFGFPAVDHVGDDGVLIPAWKEWRQVVVPVAGGARSDTLAAFSNQYAPPAQQASNTPPVLQHGGASVAVQNSGNVPSVHSAPVKLKQGPQEEVEDLIDPIKLASVSIEAEQWGEGSVAIFLTLVCHKWHKMTVLRGRIQIRTTPGRMTLQSFADWQIPKSFQGNGFNRKTMVIIERGGTRLDPHLDIDGGDGPIGTIAINTDLPALEGLSPGGKVVVTFGTWLPDVSMAIGPGAGSELVADPYGNDAFGHIDYEGKLITGQTEAFTAHKQWAISKIRLKAATNAGPDGYVDLSRHTLRIERANEPGQR